MLFKKKFWVFFHPSNYDHDIDFIQLEHGAKPCKSCDDGFYPIHAAATRASDKTLEVLIKHGEAPIDRDVTTNSMWLWRHNKTWLWHTQQKYKSSKWPWRHNTDKIDCDITTCSKCPRRHNKEKNDCDITTNSKWWPWRSQLKEKQHGITYAQIKFQRGYLCSHYLFHEGIF